MKWSRVPIAAVAFCFLVAQTGCTTTRTIARAPNQQGRMEHVDQSVRYYDETGRSRTAFLGIAISGGGSRAANFAGAVLAQLDSLGMLDRTTAISSVSGGSVASSYIVTLWADKRRYCPRSTFGCSSEDKLSFWDNAKTVLSDNFRNTWLESLARPDRFLNHIVTNRTRTDYFADVLDRAYLHNVTFGSLPADAPYLIINAGNQGHP